MFGRGSPRINLIQARSIQKRLSPKVAGTKKKKVSPKVDTTRAHWNAGLEKALVDLLHDHDNDCYRGQNGWSSEAWNRICKLFNEKFSHVKLTKVQIQDKKKDLKRDYRLLKQAKNQSGSHWNETLCRIEAEPPVWDSILVSYPKAKKLQNKCFPLFESLVKLYDGHLAEGTMSFTSTNTSQAGVTQANDIQEEQTEVVPFDPSLNATVVDDDDDEDLRIVEPPAATSSVHSRLVASSSGKRVAISRNKGSIALATKEERIGKKRNKMDR